jgi:peptide deformylase
VALRDVRQFPDPVLREVCAPVTTFDAALRSLAEDMLQTMYAAPGRGLAAPQIGVVQRIFVMDATWKTGDPSPQVFVNPEFVAKSENLSVAEESCLSIPGQTRRVARPDQVELRWQGLDGAVLTAVFDGFAATCIQHETDHLNGILCIDYPENAQ